MAEFELLLGRNIARYGEVSDAEFQDFLAKTVVPAFPDGFSVSDAQGHYRAPGTAAPIQERAKIITIIVPDTPETATRIAAIAAAYKALFAQDSVGTLHLPVCAAF